jgi:exonuclease VII large subunit
MILRDVEQVTADEKIKVQLARGSVEARVEKADLPE